MPDHVRPPRHLDTKLGRLRDVSREKMIEDAWRLCGEALHTGQMTLRSGKVCALEPRDQLRHVQWLSSMGRKRPVAMPVPKDIFIHQTR